LYQLLSSLAEEVSEHGRRGDVPEVIYVLHAGRLEAVFVVVEVHEVAPTERRREGEGKDEGGGG
jgi:hypothetical protein